MCTLTCAFEQVKTNIQNTFLFWSQLISRILLVFELVWKYGINYGVLDYVTFIPKIILQGHIFNDQYGKPILWKAEYKLKNSRTMIHV
jgi:hypothetical protein